VCGNSPDIGNLKFDSIDYLRRIITCVNTAGLEVVMQPGTFPTTRVLPTPGSSLPLTKVLVLSPSPYRRLSVCESLTKQSVEHPIEEPTPTFAKQRSKHFPIQVLVFDWDVLEAPFQELVRHLNQKRMIELVGIGNNDEIQTLQRNLKFGVRGSVLGISQELDEFYTPIPITETQGTLIQLISQGYTNAETAKMVGRSYHTVRTHLQVMREKNDAHSKSRITYLAVKHHVVD
jgi:DNA-binding CsgD family transcriptional regulator